MTCYIVLSKKGNKFIAAYKTKEEAIKKHEEDLEEEFVTIIEYTI